LTEVTSEYSAEILFEYFGQIMEGFAGFGNGRKLVVIRAVMRAQRDLVKITRTLTPLLVYKGAG
jgi:hypothetical protein